MKYNLKIKNYANSVQVSFYEKKITRGEKSNDEDITRNNKNNKQCINDNISVTWYNPKTCQVEVVPEGFQIIEHPFTKEIMLYPEDRFIDDNVWIDMDYENMIPIVQQKLKEERERKDFSNHMRSLRRTKQNVFEIARGSDWELFVTITIADDSVRNDLDAVKKRVSKTINNMKIRKNLDFKYLLIAERHPTSGAWHLHGLFKDINGLKLCRAVNPYTGKPIKKNNVQVYNMSDFDSLGFTTATFVQSNEKVTKYVTKYITKEMIGEFPRQKKLFMFKRIT